MLTLPTTLEHLDESLADSALSSFQPAGGDVRLFVLSRLYLTYFVRASFQNPGEIPVQVMSQWFLDAIENSSDGRKQAAVIDRFSDFCSFNPNKEQPPNMLSGQAYMARHLLRVHAMLRNLRREIIRESRFGDRQQETLANLSGIVNQCILELKEAKSEVGIDKKLKAPLAKLVKLKRRLSGITTQSFDDVLSETSFDTNVLIPFCNALALILANPPRKQSAWRGTMN